MYVNINSLLIHTVADENAYLRMGNTKIILITLLLVTNDTMYKIQLNILSNRCFT